MKKVLVILLVVVLSAGTLFAAKQDYKGASKKNELDVGLNLGTDMGVILNYGMGKFDVEGIIGFGFLPEGGIHVECGAAYEVVDVAKECHFDGAMPFTIGISGDLGIAFGDSASVSLGVIVPLKLAYTFEKFPASLYIRIAPGVLLNFAKTFTPGFAIEASIGATYNFDLK